MSRGDMDPLVAIFVYERDKGCLGPRLGGSFMDCASPERLEHIHEGYGQMGRRAPSCPCSLAVLCSGHTEPGTRAGYCWCTDKANRQALRDYLATFGYGPHHVGHAAEILARVPA